MRVLIVSHNVISRASNMGKTILSYFKEFREDNIAQLYIHSEVPTDDSICRDYFRFTDKDALKSIIPFRVRGTVFRETDICKDRDFSRTDSGLMGDVYQFGRKRTATIYAMRDLVWKISHWNTKRLRQWVDEFDPDVIFYASGDYGFTYDIARKIADYTGKPLVVVCMDDYYLHNRNANSAFGRIVHRIFMKTVCKTMKRASLILTISDTMKCEYEKLFDVPCRTLHTGAKFRELQLDKQADRISYIGNLGFKRNLQLVEMGRALKKLYGNAYMIDVYSGERNPEILKSLTEENGIRFHGQISAEAVFDVMRHSMAVIHTESFDEKTVNKVRFSVSTKIAESLMYGPCLIAYGPRGIASIDYLEENKAAWVIGSLEELGTALSEIIENPRLRDKILENARALAKKNHDEMINSKNVRRWLKECVGE